MKFGGKADVKGFFTRMSNSIGRHKRLEYEIDDKSSAGESDSKELEVEAMAQSFINDDQLRNFNPGMGTANLQVLGESNDGALDINFHWEESDAAGEESQASCSGQLTSTPKLFRSSIPFGSANSVLSCFGLLGQCA